MSVEQMALVLNHSRAKGTDKLILIGIANHDGDGGAWPSIETLARYANCTERSVQNSISNLVALGELSVEYQAGGTVKTRNDRRSNLYAIHVDGVKPTSPREADGVKQGAPRGEAHCVDGVKPTSPEPSLNHPENHPENTRDLEFDRFWSLYPRKVDKKNARKVWDRSIQRTRPEKITAGLADRVLWWEASGTPMRLIKHPTTWLYGECWNDEIEPVERVAVKQTTADRHERGGALADAFGDETPFEAMLRLGHKELTA